MKLLHRRQFLHLAAGSAALPVVARSAWAQTYPTRPVHLIVNLAPGGGLDFMARVIGEYRLRALLGTGGSSAASAFISAPRE